MAQIPWAGPLMVRTPHPSALTLMGLLIGAAVAPQLVGELLFGVTARDAATFAVVALVMMGVAVTASLAPANVDNGRGRP